MKVEVVTPEEHMGDVIGDLNARRGTVTDFLDKPGNLRLIRAFVPLSEMFSYISNLRGACFDLTDLEQFHISFADLEHGRSGSLAASWLTCFLGFMTDGCYLGCVVALGQTGATMWSLLG